MNTHSYIPALRFKWLTPLYDLLVGITMPESRIKQELIEGAGLTNEQKVLDFGCGTATLTMMAKESYPAAHVTGIDVDVEILQKATAKVRRKELNITLLNYDGLNLPFLDNHFQTILSCLVFHHLTTDNKKRALAEIFRVVQKNGQLHIADFGRSALWSQRALFNTIRALDGFQPTSANAKGLLPELIAEAGFENVCIQKRFSTMFGEVQIINAIKKQSAKPTL